MTIKPGVNLAGVRPEVAIALTIVARVFADKGLECVVTSVTDGKHGRGSLHYVGQAADLRNATVPPNQRPLLASALREALGPQFDVVAEPDHFHLEFQPK
jgi:hypothetical protein